VLASYRITHHIAYRQLTLVGGLTSAVIGIVLVMFVFLAVVKVHVLNDVVTIAQAHVYVSTCRISLASNPDL
jgi:hypothetical protein